MHCLQTKNEFYKIENIEESSSCPIGQFFTGLLENSERNKLLWFVITCHAIAFLGATGWPGTPGCTPPLCLCSACAASVLPRCPASLLALPITLQHSVVSASPWHLKFGVFFFLPISTTGTKVLFTFDAGYRGGVPPWQRGFYTAPLPCLSFPPRLLG